MSAPKKILGFGNPLLDLMTTSVEQSVLDEWGAQLNNAMLAEEKHAPLFKSLVATHPIEYVAGGATLNSIRVAQWVLTAQGKTGCSGFIGCIGKDENGAQMKTQLTKDGVAPHFMETDAKPTGTCAVLVKDAERALVANLAAAESYDKAAHFDTPAIQKVVEEASIFYSAAFPLTHEGGAATVKAIVEGASDDKIVCMNVSAPFICMVPPLREMLLAGVNHCNYLFCNESEAEELAKNMGWDAALAHADKMQEVAKMMAALPNVRKGGLKAVITQGADATLIACAGNVTTYEVKANPWTLTKADLKDTNGAGDAFVGGFLSQLALGADEAACVKMGHFAAGTIIQNPGCTCPAYDTVAKVLA